MDTKIDRGGVPLALSQAEQVAAIEAIRRIFAARLRVMDTKQWHLYGSMHTEDVVSETFDPANPVVGREALTSAIRSVLDGKVYVSSVHHGHTPEIRLTSDNSAEGIWAMEDELWWMNDDVEEHLHGYGHYHERYRKVKGEWLISHRRLTRLRVSHTPNFFDYRSG